MYVYMYIHMYAILIVFVSSYKIHTFDQQSLLPCIDHDIIIYWVTKLGETTLVYWYKQMSYQHLINKL